MMISKAMGSFLSSLCDGGIEEARAWALAVDSRIKTFRSTAHLKLHLRDLKDFSRLVVIVFFTYWCGPCKIHDMVIRLMADKFTDVEFIRIDVGALADVAEFQVQVLPTFVLLKKGKEVDRLVGANKVELQKKIEKHHVLQS